MLRTWDIFDTLIARKCILPQNVFQIVEEVGKVKGFKNARVAAEQMLIKAGVNYNYDDIYKKFEEITKANRNIVEHLKKLELKTEMEQIIPITENLKQVKSGDILISDMYLPEEIIRKMLDKVGLFVPVEVVVTSGGKANGKIWKQLKNQDVYLFHTGDNEIIDIANPRQFGFDSSWTVFHRANQVESQLLKMNFDFASYLRSIRLKNPFNEEVKRTYWFLFTINIGILILYVKLIDQFQKKYGFEYLGFCGRDTYYMHQLYKKYKEDNNEQIPANDYLYYSRKLVLNSEKELKSYFSSRINNKKALLLDLTGTGYHLNRLRNNANLKYSMLICKWDGFESSSKNHPEYKDYTWSWHNVTEDVLNDPIENLSFYGLNLGKWNYSIELVNRATHNSPIRLKSREIANKIIPEVIFTEVDDTENLEVFENCINEVLKSKIPWSSFKNMSEIIPVIKFLLDIFNAYAEKMIFKSQHDIQEKIDNYVKWLEQQKNK